MLSNNSDESSSSAIKADLITLWKSVLNVDSIRPEDTFLELGGDSMTAMLCASRIRNMFGIELLLEDFFADDATVDQLAGAIQHAQES